MMTKFSSSMYAVPALMGQFYLDSTQKIMGINPGHAEFNSGFADYFLRKKTEMLDVLNTYIMKNNVFCE